MRRPGPGLPVASQAVEHALRFDVGPTFRLPRLPGTPIAPGTFVSTYYDTSDHRLARAGVTVCRRTGGRKHRWQVELPHGGERIEVAGPGAPGPPPEALGQLLPVYTRGAELVPVATLATRRSGMLVRGIEGPVARVVLDRVSVLDGPDGMQQFREIEVEPLGKDEEALDRLGVLLEASGARPGLSHPQLFRAIGLDPPREPAAPSASAPTVDHVRAMMRVQRDGIRTHDPGTRLGSDPEDLHKMRTAVRRLRAILRAARPVFHGEWVEDLRRELDWLGGALGAVRDLDVLLASLRGEVAAFDRSERAASQRFLDRLEAERASARTDLLAALNDPRYFALLDKLDDAVDRSEGSAAVISLADIAAAEFKKLRKAVERLPEEPSDGDMHAVRIKVKRARYTAELAEPLAGRAAERFIARARALQDVLGEHQDAVVAEQRLRALFEGARGRRAAFVAGRLVERQRSRRVAARNAFLERWKKVERRGRKAWG